MENEVDKALHSWAFKKNALLNFIEAFFNENQRYPAGYDLLKAGLTDSWGELEIMITELLGEGWIKINNEEFVTRYETIPPKVA